MTSIWLRTGLLVTAVLAGGVQTAQAEVNIYSARTEALIKPLLDQFSAQTGIIFVILLKTIICCTIINYVIKLIKLISFN